MNITNNNNGFTFIEIMIAVTIMALGFIFVSEMQFLSLRQKDNAESGTVATNIIQFVADRDIAEVKRLHGLNSVTYLDALAGRTPLDTSYCDGTAPSLCANPPCKDPCDSCPCDPLTAITPNPAAGTTEQTCATIDSKDLDPDLLDFKTVLSACTGGDFYIVKNVDTIIDTTISPDIITVTVDYAVKTPAQLKDTGFSTTIRDSLASQTFEFTAHVDTTWSNFIPTWTEVRVPHVP